VLYRKRLACERPYLSAIVVTSGGLLPTRLVALSVEATFSEPLSSRVTFWLSTSQAALIQKHHYRKKEPLSDLALGSVR
jgi:hypothetical protein